MPWLSLMLAFYLKFMLQPAVSAASLNLFPSLTNDLGFMDICTFIFVFGIDSVLAN